MHFYYLADTVEEALETLAKHENNAAVICGGTDLVVQMKAGSKKFDALVDISRIEELKDVTRKDGFVQIGGAATHAAIAASPMVSEFGSALVKGCGVVGSPQIRNVGSLSGNIVNAQPAADGAVALIALGGDAVICGPEGERTAPIEDLYLGVGQSKVDCRREIITQLRFRELRLEDGEASAMQRLSQRNMLSLPMINVAVAAKVKNGCFVWLRVAIGPIAQTPFRSKETENMFIGAPATKGTIREIAEHYRNLASPRDSRLRGSADYRKEMVGLLAERALLETLSAFRRQ